MWNLSGRKFIKFPLCSTTSIQKSIFLTWYQLTLMYQLFVYISSILVSEFKNEEEFKSSARGRKSRQNHTFHFAKLSRRPTHIWWYGHKNQRESVEREIDRIFNHPRQSMDAIHWRWNESKYLITRKTF